MSPEQRNRLIEVLASGEELSPEWSRILFPPEKREYELVYHGKDREEDIIANTLAVPLQAVRTFNKNGVLWDNKLVFGDNLQAMKTLLEMKRRGELCNADGTPGVRLVYIDPPFATMRDFSGTDDERAYQDKIGGAQFVEFLRRRLLLLRELLSDDGAIYVHLDQKKVHYIKVVMDEIFGEGRLRNEVIWHYKFRMMDSDRKFNKKHDTILFYAKSDAHQIDMPKEEWTREEIISTRKQEIHTDPDGREWIHSRPTLGADPERRRRWPAGEVLPEKEEIGGELGRQSRFDPCLPVRFRPPVGEFRQSFVFWDGFRRIFGFDAGQFVLQGLHCRLFLGRATLRVDAVLFRLPQAFARSRA